MILLAFAVFPATFFFRMMYSESSIVCLIALTMLAVEARAPLWLIAFLVGLATGARPVGVGLALVVVREIARRSETWQAFAGRCLLYLPLALWGIVAYSSYLAVQFGEPLAYVNAQRAWDAHPPVTSEEKAIALLTLKPIWGSFLPDSGYFFASDTALGEIAVSASGANAVVFIFGLALIAVGIGKRWLNVTECLIAAVLLGIPYLTKGVESQFLSFARFTAIVLPIYIPLGMLLIRLPLTLRIGYLLLCTWLITILAALFTAGYHLV